MRFQDTEFIERAAIRLFDMKVKRRGTWPEATEMVKSAHRRRVREVLFELLEPTEDMKQAADDAANLPVDALPADVFTLMVRVAAGMPLPQKGAGK